MDIELTLPRCTRVPAAVTTICNVRIVRAIGNAFVSAARIARRPEPEETARTLAR